VTHYTLQRVVAIIYDAWMITRQEALKRMTYHSDEAERLLCLGYDINDAAMQVHATLAVAWATVYAGNSGRSEVRR